MAAYDRLSALDASFLRLERLETPMHVGAVSILEGGPLTDERGRFRLEEVRALVASRLHLIPRFRRRIMEVPMDQGRPIWVDDERFEIAYHVRLAALPAPGDFEQLRTLVARVQAQLLDRSRPLWELWFVEGLEGGHVALIQKTHHALVDGVSGVDVATVLLDVTPETTMLDPPRWTPEPPPDSTTLLRDSLWERVTQPGELLSSAGSMVRAPGRAVSSSRRLTRSLSSLVSRNVVAPRTSLNATVGRHRRLETVRIPLDDVKLVRKAFGGTVNDVVLAGATGGLRRILEARGELDAGLELRTFCPVSIRDESEQLQLGNRVSGMFVPVPVGDPDPRSRLRAIQEHTADLKDREQAVGADFLLGLAQYAAPTLLGLAARVTHHQRFANLVVTNIPGPQFPLYCMGARLLEPYPVVPLALNLTVAVGILSYCGALHFGLFADRDAFSDLETFATGIVEAFAELVELAARPDG
ncbi:MAG: wax ester/triacylglycerol synthase family O-acyltransferase [Acidimicrobiia bacterium]